MSWYRYLFLMVAALLTACASIGGATTHTPTPSLPFETLVPPETIKALDQPETVPAGEASAYVAPLEEVIGVTIEGESRAYPLGMMGRHEIVNDTIGGKPVSVTYCTHCLTGVVFSRRVESSGGAVTELTFGVSGKLLDGALVMIDRETGSLWPQSRLEAVTGEFSGAQLELISSTQVPWRDWVSTHPDTTLVVDGREKQVSRNFSLPFAPEQQEATQPQVRSYILGVASDQAALALPLKAVEEAGVVNEEVAGLPPFVVISLQRPGIVRGWTRKVDGRTLTFYRDGETLRDKETGSEWDAEEGIALSGPLDGTRLKPRKLEIVHWLGWKDLYPDSRVWQPKAEEARSPSLSP